MKLFKLIKDKFSINYDELNGINNLPENLRSKLKTYDNSPNIKIGEYFTWEEFCTIFREVKAVFSLTYKENIGVTLIHDLSDCCLLVEFDYKENICDFKTPDELLENACVMGLNLKSIWNNLR